MQVEIEEIIMYLTCGFTTYCPFVADLMSKECSNSLVIDSMVLAGLGKDDVDIKTSLVAGCKNMKHMTINVDMSQQ